MERLEYAGENDWGGGLRHEVFERLLWPLPYGLSWRLRYLRGHHRWPHLSAPRSLNEKTLWRILYDRRPELGLACDKLASKRLVAERVPGLRIPAVYWSGTDLRELAEVDLPDQWVLKPNNTSGLIHFGAGSLQPDEAAELARLTRGWIDRPFDKRTAYAWEWGYSQAERCFLVEERLDGGSGGVGVAKVQLFDGEPRFLVVVDEILAAPRRCVFRADGTPADIRLVKYPPPDVIPEFPARADEMFAAARSLGSLLEFLLVDFHVLPDGSIAFAELTVYPNAGILRWEPWEADLAVGALWDLPGRDAVAAG